MNIRRWLTATDHKDVGILYLVTSLVFLLVGGALALLMRLQLARPDGQLLSPDLYNQMVTMHGAVMVLFFLSPFAFGFANYVVPLQIGAKDLAFPRINGLSYWLYLAGGIVAASGFLAGGAADVGWTFYAPLTSKTYSPGLGVDLAGIGLLLLGTSVTVGTLNFMVTILRHRRPGLRLYDVPMFTWCVLFTLIIMLLAFPAIAGALGMLLADRHFGTHFFDPDLLGGELWTHLFWFFGHPEVYIILLPPLGAAMEVVSTFSRRPLYGKKAILWSLAIATGLSFAVWVHHMFTTGTSEHLREGMSITTEAISIPFGVVYLSMAATMWGGSLRLKTPLLMAIASMGLFLLGGITGVFLSSLSLDPSFRGTYWVVAHFHFTLVGGAVLMMLSGLYYWYPKMTGRMYDERLGRLHVGLSVAGFLMTFLTMFFYSDMPRRIYTYGTADGWGGLNLLATAGAFLFGIAQIIMLWNLATSLRRGPPAPADPWGGPGLEWTLPSPPTAHGAHGGPHVPAMAAAPAPPASKADPVAKA